jgi:hypothetical protein
MYGGRRDAYMILMSRSQGRRPLERPRHSRIIILKLTLKKWD